MEIKKFSSKIAIDTKVKYIIPTVSDSGVIGGKVSEEFQAITVLGEDKTLYDKKIILASIKNYLILKIEMNILNN